MELNIAKEKLEEIVGRYKSQISELGINTWADVYVGDSKALTKIEESADEFDLLFASITISASDSKEESDATMCGFDLVVDVKKKSEVNDKEFDNALSEFSETAEDFIKRLSKAPDKNEFIKSESDKEKERAAENMKQFEADMRKTQTTAIALGCGIAFLIIVAVFATFIFR